MNFSEKYGNDIDEAVELALKDLKVSKDEVDIEVLEEPSKGFLGLGSKLAKVRVTIKQAEESETYATAEEIYKETVAELSSDNNGSEETEKESERKKANKKSGNGQKKQSKNRKSNEGKISDNDQQSKRKSIADERPEGLEPADDHIAVDFLKKTTEEMGMNLTFSCMANEENVYIDIKGEDAGNIIGKRGQTLDAVQYLTSLVVNKDSSKYIRVILDAENYRAKREKTLQQLADRLAAKVVRTRRSVRLEPMNPYERMVIHAALQGNKKVTTRSEGEEPYRRLIIDLKK